MSNSKFIYNTEIKPGENTIINLPIESLATGTPIKTAVYVFNGIEEGPTILIQGGLHGDEVNGVEICKRLLAFTNLNKVNKGCVIIIPVLNVYGFLHFSREASNGKDVNRSFPGSRLGSLASRIAYFHTKEILPHIDFGIDLHTGGAMRFNYPQIRYTSKTDESEKLASIFNAPFQFVSPLIKKSFRETAHKKSKPIIVYEAGESMRFDEFAINQGLKGIYNILKHFNFVNVKNSMLDDKKNTIEISESKWIRARRSGMVTKLVNNSEFVEKDQIIANITDAFGKRKREVKAPFSGHIFCVNNMPIVAQGNPLFRIGKIEN